MGAVQHKSAPRTQHCMLPPPVIWTSWFLPGFVDKAQIHEVLQELARDCDPLPIFSITKIFFTVLSARLQRMVCGSLLARSFSSGLLSSSNSFQGPCERTPARSNTHTCFILSLLLIVWPCYINFSCNLHPINLPIGYQTITLSLLTVAHTFASL